MENWLQQANILNRQLGLTPYESRAYVAIIVHGPMSPSEIAQKAHIPRPRAYDVLQSLMERGLLVEQSGKPAIYASVEPVHGLKNLVISMEKETSKQLEEKRKNIETLAKQLSEMYDRSKSLKLEKNRVWFTQRNIAFIATYSEAIRNCEKELVVASTDPRAPEKEILEAVKNAVEKGTRVKVVRQITDLWTVEDLTDYEKYIKAGSQVRYLDIREIPLRFMVFDEKDVILVFPSESESTTLEALWLRIPPLAKILHKNFEELWKKGKPMSPVLKEIKKKKLEKVRHST
jgi:sugar-specific transcriptional regulator TrmB